MGNKLLSWTLLAGLVLPAGVTTSTTPKGVSLDRFVHEAGAGHRFEKIDSARVQGVRRPRWARSYMLGHGGEGLGAFEWVHEELVAVPRGRGRGFRILRFRTDSFDPVLRGKERKNWDRFLSRYGERSKRR
jgi:hypothetical protein